MTTIINRIYFCAEPFSTCGFAFLAMLMLLFMVGCSDNQPVGTGSEEVLMKGHGQANSQGMAANFAQSDAGLIRALTSATARYHSTNQALRDGYVEDDHCVAVPGLGGMGFHWGNPGLIDPVFNPLEPEVVIYAPDKNGNLKLVAVEFIVLDIGQPHPHFGDYPLDVGGTPIPVPHWSLHVWLWKTNPNGLFTPFNPDVTCP